jgi:hypothetical protein
VKVLSIHDLDDTLRATKNSLKTRQRSVGFNGPPGALVASIVLENAAAEPVFVDSLRIGKFRPLYRKDETQQSKSHTSRVEVSVPAALHIQQELGEKESRAMRMQLSLPEQTPPGEYEFDVEIGTETITARATVQPVLDVELVPSTLFFVGTKPGTQHKATILFANHGNVPLVVPTLRHGTTLDLDIICRNLSLAVRDKGDESATATLDEFFRLIKNDMAGWVDISVKEAGSVVAPGEAVNLHITFKLPESMPKANVIHDGDIRIYDELLSYIVAPNP